MQIDVFNFLPLHRHTDIHSASAAVYQHKTIFGVGELLRSRPLILTVFFAVDRGVSVLIDFLRSTTIFGTDSLSCDFDGKDFGKLRGYDRPPLVTVIVGMEGNAA
jgi:hypothetical protein